MAEQTVEQLNAELLKDFKPEGAPEGETEEQKTTRVEAEKTEHVKKKKEAFDGEEIDLGDGKKIKRGELRKGFMQEQDYTKKNQDLSAEKENLKELLNWSKAIKANPKMIKAVVALTDKGLGNEKVLDKVLTALEVLEEKKDEIIEGLEDIDDSTPEGKALKKALVQISALQKSIETQATKITEGEGKQTKTQEEAAVKEAQQVLTGTLETLTDTEKGGLTFDNEEETKLWRMLVVSYLKDNPKEYKDKADFVTTVNEVGKKWHGALQKYGEAKLAKYLKSKKTPVPGEGAPGGPAAEDITMDNLQEGIEKSLKQIESEKT